MNAEEVNDNSPVRALEEAMHGSLGAGRLGVVLARAGVGKTACLVQVALDTLLREGRVLHVHLGGETIDNVKLWYDTLIEDLVRHHGLEDNGTQLGRELESRRIIHLLSGGAPPCGELDRAIELYANNLGFRPDLIVLDNLDWSGSTVRTAAMIGELKAAAGRVGAAVWVTAQTYRNLPPTHDSAIPAPADRFDELIDVAVRLEPTRDGFVALHLLKDLDGHEQPDASVLLDPHTMRLVTDPRDARQTSLPANFRTLLSGAARGAEATFGHCAETWGLSEIHYTFEGKPVARARGLQILSEAQLQRGAARTRAVRNKAARKLPDRPLLNRVLLSIWHQVESAGQVFVVGSVDEDGAVRGGTGWAAELAREQGKPLYVFDQDRGHWMTWQGDTWVQADNPRITARRFTGTGSRNLNDSGREAIQTLFERSFGTAPVHTH